MAISERDLIVTIRRLAKNCILEDTNPYTAINEILSIIDGAKNESNQQASGVALYERLEELQSDLSDIYNELQKRSSKKQKQGVISLVKEFFTIKTYEPEENTFYPLRKIKG